MRSRSTNPTIRFGMDSATRMPATLAQSTGNESLVYMGIVEDDECQEHEGSIIVNIPALSAPTRSAPGQVLETEYRDSYGNYKCYPILPFFGTNDAREARDGFAQSYGLWAGNPRKGDFVVVVFVNGLIPYWFGCIPRTIRSGAMPGHAGYEIEGYDDIIVPGSEMDERSHQETDRKAGGDLADAIKEAGLGKDRHRGAGTQSRARETPSKVFGWKTPGNPDAGMNGHSFTMDDFVDDQLIRMRTATGHQIMLNDTTGSIYISTSRGTSWIEVSDAGIDLFTNGDYAVHAMGNISHRAEGDIVFDAVGAIRTRAGGDMVTAVGGKVNETVAGNVTQTITGEHHLVAASHYLTTEGDMHVNVAEAYTSTSGAMHLKAGGDVNLDASNFNQQGGLAQDAEEADEADEIETEELPGPPASETEAGENVEYVSGARVPQHEPWKPDGRIVVDAIASPGHGREYEGQTQAEEARSTETGASMENTAAAARPEGEVPWEGDEPPAQSGNGRIVANRKPYVTSYWHEGPPGRRIGSIPHKGIDFRGRMGAEYYNPVPGVVRAMRSGGGRGGGFISVQVEGGKMLTVRHVRPKAGISVGQTVKAGDVIAYSDGSGGVTPHFHVDLRDARGRDLNPRSLLTSNGVQMVGDGQNGGVG